MLGILSLEQTKIVSSFCATVISENEHVLSVYAINKNGRIIDVAKRNNSYHPKSIIWKTVKP
jgi:hypothetical protein